MPEPPITPSQLILYWQANLAINFIKRTPKQSSIILATIKALQRIEAKERVLL